MIKLNNSENTTLIPTLTLHNRRTTGKPKVNHKKTIVHCVLDLVSCVLATNAMPPRITSLPFRYPTSMVYFACVLLAFLYLFPYQTLYAPEINIEFIVFPVVFIIMFKEAANTFVKLSCLLLISFQ